MPRRTPFRSSWAAGRPGPARLRARAAGARARLRAAGRRVGGRGKQPIRVGHFASLTGDTATFGQSTDRGIRMAIEEINATGGVLGRPLELISEDDRSITEEARTAAQKLLQRDQVVALLGEVASSRSLAAAPEAQRAQDPDDLAGLDQPEGDRGRRLRVPHLLHRPLPGRGDGALRARGARRRSASRSCSTSSRTTRWASPTSSARPSSSSAARSSPTSATRAATSSSAPSSRRSAPRTPTRSSCPATTRRWA